MELIFSQLDGVQVGLQLIGDGDGEGFDDLI